MPDSTIPPAPDFSVKLQEWLEEAAITSWAELSRRSSLSRHRVSQLRGAQIESWPLEQVIALCQCLNISLEELLVAVGLALSQPASLEFSEPEVDESIAETTDTSHSTEIREALEQLEPFLRQWPTAVYAAQHHNLPAQQLIRVLAPVEQLLSQWTITPLGDVGETVPFDPSWQQLLTDEMCEVGQPVSIRYVGYRWQDKLWLRAQVRPTAG